MLNKARLFVGLLMIVYLIASCLGTSDPDFLGNGGPRSNEFSQVSGLMSPNDVSNVNPGGKYNDSLKKRRKKSESEDDTETEDNDESSEPPPQTSTESEKSAGSKFDGEGPKIWDQWGNWSSCSVTCGIGTSERWRHCIGGRCVPGEKKAQFRTCTFAAC